MTEKQVTPEEFKRYRRKVKLKLILNHLDKSRCWQCDALYGLTPGYCRLCGARIDDEI